MKRAFFVLLFLASCQLVQVAPQQPRLPVIYTGTSALELSFAPTSTRNIFMCQQADLFVNFRNTGAFEIRNGVYSFILEDQVLRPVGEKQRKFSLEGKSEFNPPGGFDQIGFKVQSVGLPEQLEVYSSPVLLQACYAYKTFASLPVCVDPDVQNINPRKACRAEVATTAGGQGAPVAVARVEPLMVPAGDQVRPVFVVYLQHVGSGLVVMEENVEAVCKAEAKADVLLSYVNINAELQGVPLNCRPVPVRLEANKESRVVCESDLLFGPAAGTFSTVLSVELSYGYVSNAVWPMTINRLPGQQSCS